MPGMENSCGSLLSPGVALDLTMRPMRNGGKNRLGVVPLGTPEVSLHGAGVSHTDAEVLGIGRPPCAAVADIFCVELWCFFGNSV